MEKDDQERDGTKGGRTGLDWCFLGSGGGGGGLLGGQQILRQYPENMQFCKYL